MDAKLKDKDICTDSTGEYVMIDGIEEIIQRAVISLTVPKGSFVYDKNLGSDYNDFKANDIKQAEMIINESLVNMGNVYIKVKSISNEGNKINMSITVNYNNISVDKEVVI